MKKLFAVVLFGAMSVATSYAQFGPTGTTNLNVNVVAEAAIRVDTANTNLISAGSFANYLGTTNYTFKIRTTNGGGAGAVVVKISTDFAPAGGPTVGSGNLTYSCVVGAPVTGTGTACAGPVTATAADTSVATFGNNTHSLGAGTGGSSVAWTLLNDAAYITGSYTGVATFTISAS